MPLHDLEPVDARRYAEWDRLADRLDAPPFARPGFVGAWWRAFAPAPPLLVTARRDRELIACMPLLRSGRALRAPADWHSEEHVPLVEDAVSTELLIARLLANRLPAIDIGFLGADSHLARALAARRPAGYRVWTQLLQSSPYLDLNGSWSNYEAELPKKVRAELRRRHRRLSELGAVTHDASRADSLAADPRALQQLLAEGVAVEASGWKGDSGTAIRSNPATAAFYSALATWAAREGMLRLAFLRVGGRAVAFDLTLEHLGVRSLLKTGYDQSTARWSPGSLLRQAELRCAFDEGCSRYDLLGADAPWKRIWATTTRDKLRVVLFREDAAGAAWALRWRYAPAVSARTRRAVATARDRVHDLVSRRG